VTEKDRKTIEWLQEYAGIDERIGQLESEHTMILIEPMKMALMEALRVHVQPKGEKRRSFDTIVPTEKGNWNVAVKNLRTRINHVYGGRVV